MFKNLEFITPTFTRVLELFLSDPLQEYHGRQVVRLTGVSLGSANKILRLMAGLGFLTAQRKGRMVFYKLDIGNPSVRQFKILSNVYSLHDLVGRLKGACRRMVLFGSSSEGRDAKESDIDMLIVTDDKEAVRREINRFNAKGKRRIAAIVVDANGLARLRREDRPLYENIERGIVLWETE